MNCVARADYTVAICAIGLLGLWFQKRAAALLFFYCLVGTLFIDVAWLSVHGHYLDKFGRIPASAPETIVDLMRLHKWSLGMSCVMLLTKVMSLYPSYKFYCATRGCANKKSQSHWISAHVLPDASSIRLLFNSVAP